MPRGMVKIHLIRPDSEKHWRGLNACDYNMRSKNYRSVSKEEFIAAFEQNPDSVCSMCLKIAYKYRYLKRPAHG